MYINFTHRFPYRAWMGYNSYEKHYLFTDGKLCCDKFFPGASSCPEIPDEIDTGYYWESYQENLNNGEAMPIVYNHTYYPDVNAGTCVKDGKSPKWMHAEGVSAILTNCVLHETVSSEN